MVVTNSQESCSHIDTRHALAKRQPFGHALNDWSMAECRHESHREGALYEFEQHPDMCESDGIRLAGYDNVTGEYIKLEFIEQARCEELKGFRDMKVYEYVSREEALRDFVGTVVCDGWEVVFVHVCGVVLWACRMRDKWRVLRCVIQRYECGLLLSVLLEKTLVAQTQSLWHRAIFSLLNDLGSLFDG